MRKQHIVLTGIMCALSMGVASAAPVNIVLDNGNVGLQGTTYTNDANVTIGNGAGAANNSPQLIKGPNSTGNNVAIGAFASSGAKGGGNVTLGSKSFQNGSGDMNVIAGVLAGNKSTQSQSIIMGTQAGDGSTGFRNVWLGNYQGANSTATNSVLIGSNSTVNGNFTLGIGHYTNINANKGLSIGSFNTLSENATESGVFGQGTFGKTAIDASGAYSIGNYNHISGNNTFVLGNNVTTALENAVILGNDSTDGDVVGTSGYTFNDGTHVSYAGTAPISTVSIGAVGKERTITNLAAGRVSPTSTDAINGSQLYGAHKMIDHVQNESNKGDARAAALAALHPLAYDPDNRVQYMAGYGHYKNANAVALGVGYYHRDNLLFTTGLTVNDHIMANVGITYKPGKSKSVSTSANQTLESRVQALETQNKELQEQVRQLMAKLDR